MSVHGMSTHDHKLMEYQKSPYKATELIQKVTEAKRRQ